MKKYLAILVLALAAMPLNAGKIVTGSIDSKTLGATVKYNVYLPNGYKAENHYPVLYLLHGFTDTYTAWVEKGGVETVADELIASGEMVPTIIVMPNAGGPEVYETWNGYFNMPGWNYEDFFFGEFLPEVEKKYNCGGAKGRRAVSGLSMGGGGSLVYAQRHPELFSSCYAMSPWLDNKENEVNTRTDGQDKVFLVREAVKRHSAIDFLSNADQATLAALRTVAWFVDCGDDDFLLQLSMDFHMKMREVKVHNELRVRNGVHNWEYWHLALRMSLPFASRNFGEN